MDSTLIVSRTDKTTEFIKQALQPASIRTVAAAASCTQARRLLTEREFDLAVINAPLHDESGEALARDIVAQGSTQVILIVKADYYEAVGALCEPEGILTVAKPLNRSLLWSALMLAKATHSRLRRAQDENLRLQQKIEDIRTADKAKCLLIACMGLDEQQAHRYIEKLAMDTRKPKREVAQEIIRQYG